MRVAMTKPLFAWDCLDHSPDLKTIMELLATVPDARLLAALRRWRGRGRDDYPVHVLWGACLLKVLLRHRTVEDTLAELRRNPPLCRLIGIESKEEIPAPSAVRGSWAQESEAARPEPRRAARAVDPPKPSSPPPTHEPTTQPPRGFRALAAGPGPRQGPGGLPKRPCCGSQRWRDPPGLSCRRRRETMRPSWKVHVRRGAESGRANRRWAWAAQPQQLKAIAAGTGKVLWEIKTGLAPMTLAADSRRVCFFDGASVVCLDRANGRKLWTSQSVGGRKPSIVTGFAPKLIIHGDRVLYSPSGAIHAFDAQTGKTLWSVKCKPRSGHHSCRKAG